MDQTKTVIVISTLIIIGISCAQKYLCISVFVPPGIYVITIGNT